MLQCFFADSFSQSTRAWLWQRAKTVQSWLMPQSPHHLRNDLKCVKRDVKPCSIQSNLSETTLTAESVQTSSREPAAVQWHKQHHWAAHCGVVPAAYQQSVFLHTEHKYKTTDRPIHIYSRCCTSTFTSYQSSLKMAECLQIELTRLSRKTQ